VTKLQPDLVPPVAGLDNAKLKVFDDYTKIQREKKPGAKTTLETDLEALQKVKKESGKVEPKLEENLNKLSDWWDNQGSPNYGVDKPKLDEARLVGGKTALLWTAGVPAAMAVGFLLLVLFFAATGGYKQVHIHDGH
jgi:hypothetical protein